MKKTMTKIAVLVSGGGTNLQALIDAEKRGELGNGKISLVIASKPGVYALERAANNEIDSLVLARKDYNRYMKDFLTEYLTFTPRLFRLFVAKDFTVCTFTKRHSKRVLRFPEQLFTSLLPSVTQVRYFFKKQYT